MALDYIEGVLKIANVILSLVAGYIGVMIFRLSHRRELRAWKILIFALALFLVQEILGALRAFGIYSSPFLTHVVPSALLCLLIYALAMQMHIHVIEK
jgi:hypothetical protein